ncbi:MAG TPA: hypothetical protein VMZ92_14955 [Planctomycetota bacterium]|nr:hypothetical protein [Planctomycetota bacterium]
MGWIEEKHGWLPYWDDRFTKPLDHLPYWDDRRAGEYQEDEAQRRSPFVVEGDDSRERQQPSIFEQAERKMQEDERRWASRTPWQAAVDWVMPPSWDKETSVDEPVTAEPWDTSASVDSSRLRGVPWEYFDPEDPEFTQKVASRLTEFMRAGLITLKELDGYLSEAYVTNRIPSRGWLQRRKIRGDAEARRQRLEQELRQLRARVGPMRKIGWRLSEDARTAVALEDATLWELAEVLTGSGANWCQFGYGGDPEKMSVGTAIDVSRWTLPLLADIRGYGESFLRFWTDLESIARVGGEEALQSLSSVVREVAEKGSGVLALGCAALSVPKVAKLFGIHAPRLEGIARVGVYFTLAGMSFDLHGLHDAIRHGRGLDAVQRGTGLVGGGLALTLEALRKGATHASRAGRWGIWVAFFTVVAVGVAALIEYRARKGFDKAQKEANREYIEALKRRVESTAFELRRREKRVIRAIEVLVSFQ